MPTNSTPLQDYQHPQDIEAEASLLGCIMLDNSVTANVHEIVDRDCFYNTSHQIIYEAMLKLYDERVPIDLVTLKNDLEKRGDGILDKIGGTDYLMTVLESVPSAANADHYARIIREKYIIRTILQTCNEIMRQAAQPTAESDKLLDDAQRLILDVAQKKDATKNIHIKDLLKETFESRILSIRDRKGRLLGLPTGLTKLDDMLGGLQGGQFIVVAGRPGSGKSSFGLKLMEQAGLIEKKPVVLYTMEVTAQQVVQNLLCAHSRIDSQKLRRGFSSDEDIRDIMLAASKYQEAPIIIDDSSALTPFDLRSRVRRLKADYDIQMVIVDYLQLMMVRDAESREREIAGISYALKSLAKELNIPVVAMAQLSRAPEQRDVRQPRPRLSDLRESGTIEQDADVVLLLYRDELHNPTTDENRNICEINIAKQRNGPTGMIKCQFQKECTRFENLYTEE